MNRNLKALGLTLLVAFAFSTMAASMAAAQSSQGELTSDGPMTLDGVEDGENWLKYPGLPGQVECPGSTIVGHKLSQTPHTLIPNSSTQVTITPTFINCRNGSSKVTVTMNGCDFVLNIGKTTEAKTHSEYGVTTDIVCPIGKVIERHVYFAENNENVLTCTLKIAEQKGLTGFDIGVEVSGGATIETLTATGTSKNLKISKEGLCGAGSTEAAEWRMNYTITGTNAAGGATGITITDTGL